MPRAIIEPILHSLGEPGTDSPPQDDTIRRLNDGLSQCTAEVIEQARARVFQRIPDSRLAVRLRAANNQQDATKTILYEDMVSPIVGGGASLELQRAFGWDQENTETEPRFDLVCDVLYDLAAIVPPRDKMLIKTLEEIQPGKLECRFQRKEQINVLETGIGTGLLVRVLRAAGYSFPVCGVDLAECWLQNLGKKAISNLHLELADVSKMTHVEKFHAALSYMMHHHVEHVEESFAGIHRALVPGGRFAYTDRVMARDPKTHRLVEIDSTGIGAFTAVPGQENIKIEYSVGPVRVGMKPHPAKLPEWHRDYRDVARMLARAGFRVLAIRVLDPVAVQYVCVKP